MHRFLQVFAEQFMRLAQVDEISSTIPPGNHLRVDQRDVERFRHELVVGVPKSPGLWYPDFFFTLPNIGGNEDLTYIRVVVDRFVVSFRAAEATTEFEERCRIQILV